MQKTLDRVLNTPGLGWDALFRHLAPVDTAKLARVNRAARDAARRRYKTPTCLWLLEDKKLWLAEARAALDEQERSQKKYYAELKTALSDVSWPVESCNMP